MRNGVNLVEVRVPHDTNDPETIVKYYQQAGDQASCRVKGLLFCNPHNPRGQIYSPSITKALLRFCEEKDIHFISDEIYALSTFGSMDSADPENTSDSDNDCKKNIGCRVYEPSSNTFTSVLQIDLEKLRVNPARVHMLYSISKDFGCSGLRLVSVAHVQSISSLISSSTGILHHTGESRIACIPRGTEQCNSIQRDIINGNRHAIRSCASQRTGEYKYYSASKGCTTSDGFFGFPQHHFFQTRSRGIYLGKAGR